MSELQEFLTPKVAKQNLEFANDRDTWKAEAERMTSGYDQAQVELAALREELALAKDTAASWKSSADGLADEAREIDKRLTAAEQRNAVLTDVERITMTILGKDKDPAPGVDWLCNRAWTANEVRDLVRSALKVTEFEATAYDRAYRNGLMQGYNLALNGSEKEYQDAVARYSKPAESGAS